MDRHARAAHYLALLAQPGIGPVTVAELTALAGGLERLVTTRWSTASRVRQPNGEWGPVPAAALMQMRGLPARVGAALPAAQRAVAEAGGAGLTVLDVDHAGYPPALRSNLTGPPPVLFVEGGLPPALSAPYELLPACAVVGTRRASRFSLTYAKDLSRDLARLGVVVVSGLALGIDAAAHAGALEGAALAAAAEGRTVAVLGGGHGRLHPAANRPLAAAIVRSGGAVLSEWPPSVEPAPHQFLQRNRIISGLSRAVVIVEAGERSGALNTASHALKQGRDVLVVPGRPGPAMAGNLAMLRDGAKMLEGLADLDETFAGVPGVGDALARLVSAMTAPNVPAPDVAAPGTGTLAERVHGLLEGLGEATVDRLLSELNSAAGSREQSTVGALTAALIELELGGAVEAAGNGRYQLRVSPVGGRGRRAT